MRKLFTIPTIEVKNFAVENIVTTSLTGQAVTGENAVENLRSSGDYTKAVINAGKVLTFSE